MTHLKFIGLALLFALSFSSHFFAQNLTISSGGQTGTTGTNWEIVGNVLNVGATGSATIDPSVITNHLLTTGNLTVNLPWQSTVIRNTYINNSIVYSGNTSRTLTFNSANDIVFADAVGITSTNASLNVVLRTALGLSLGAPDHGLLKVEGVNINTNGGHLWLGGGTGNSTWNGLTVGNSYAVTWSDDIPGISIVGSSIVTNGGKIYMDAKSWESGDYDGFNYGLDFRNSVISSGAGDIYVNANLSGKYSNGFGLRIYGTTTTSITSTSGSIQLVGTGQDATTNGNLARYACAVFGSVSIKSTSGAISITGNAAFTASVNDKTGLYIGNGAVVASQTGNITLLGTNTLETQNPGQLCNSVRFEATNAANSIRIGFDGTNAYSGNITIQGNSILQRSNHTGAGSIAIQTTGTLTMESTGTTFTSLRAGDAGTLTFDNDWNFGTNLGGFVFGKTTNTTALTYSNALATSGPITFNCSDFTLGDGINLSTSTASDITINANGSFITPGTTRRTISSANGNIIIHADKDANGSGTASIDFLTLNPGSGNIIIRFETVDWLWGSGQQPYLNGTGSITIEPGDASFPYAISTAWFFFDQDNNGLGGLTLGKFNNTSDISYTGTALTISGPVNMYGNNITFSSALTASGNLSLYANTAVTQTQPIISSGLSLNGTGTFTLTNASNNFSTLAGGATGSLIGNTQIIDVSGGLTIGTVGSTAGLTGSGTILVETLTGNLTLAGSISTTSTSTDALILTSAKSTAIGVPSGGDIIVTGSPTITIGSGAIAKLYSGYDVSSTGLTALVGGAANARYTYDETSTSASYNPALSINNKYAIYRTGLGYGDLNIVSSGGDAEGTTWSYTNGVIQTTSGTANVLNTTIQTYLNTVPVSIEANKVTFSANIVSTTSNSLSILSKTHILNTNATTITTVGGNVLFASNVDDANDGESITNGYIHFASGLTMTTNGGNITFGGGDATASGYALGSSTSQFCGIRADGIINLNSGAGNIVMRGKSYAISTGAAAWGVGFWNLTTGSITSGTGTITLDGFSQASAGTHIAGIYIYGALTITSANTTTDAIRLIGKATGVNGDAAGIETENTFSVLATADGGGITIRSSQQIANFYDVLFRGETNILAKSGPIQLLGKQDGGVANGIWYNGHNFYLGSKALSSVPTSSSAITIQYDKFSFSNIAPRIATSGILNWTPASASFGQNVGTDYFAWGQNSQTLSGLTIGKAGNAVIVYLNSAITVAGPVNAYGATIEITGALTASGDLSLYASNTVTQSVAIIAAGLSLNGTGTFTLNNASNNFTTLAGGAVGSLLGATHIVDVSGGLTIGTVGSNTGLTGSSTLRVETLANNIILAGSISTTSTSSDAVILNAAKSTAIGVGTGGDVIVSGTPTITMGSGGIAKLYSGLEATSTGLTTLAGGSSNVRNNYDETTSTFSPILSSNNKYAIYRTSSGVGALTIVASGGDAINTTWTYDNGVINTITTPVNILSSVIDTYLATGPLTINAGNTTVNAAITSTSSNALVFNANSTLSNVTPTTTVNAAITNAGAITINTGAFNIDHNISTTSAAALTISANNGFSSSSSTRRTISTQGGNITINADNDANGSGWLDIDVLTFNPGSANLIIRGETFNYNTTQTSKPYINGTGSFTFESSDAAFGETIISNWFVLDQDANGMSGLTLGNSGNTANVTLNSVFTVAGPISVYGGVISVLSAFTSSATGDILLKGISNTGSCINVAAAITKTAGTGTLTMQGYGRVNISSAILATSPGSLNVIMWSDFEGDNGGGGSTISSGGSISTNGGHVWIGGSNANGGSYTWNGLTVGDGPSTGVSGGNCNAVDLFGPITTANGDVLLWASNNGGCGLSGIQSTGSQHINAGSGDITFISDQTGGTIELTSTGVISLLPEGGSYGSALTLGGTLSSGHFSFNTSPYNGLKINSLASTGLVVGSYFGHSSGATAVTQGNTTDVTVSSALSAKSLELYGSILTLSAALSTTAGNMSLNGSTISGTPTLTLSTGSTLTMNLSSNTNFGGNIVGTSLSFVKNGAGVLTLPTPTSLSFINFTISGGTFRLNSNQQLTLSGALTNNGTFTMRSGATFVPSATVTNVTGTGTYNVQRFLTGNNNTWNDPNTSRFWYMGIPVVSAPRSSFGSNNATSNRLFSYSETTKTYTSIDNNGEPLTGGTGYVHRRATNDTLTFTGVGNNGLRGADVNQTGMTRTSGSSVGFHLVANPYMAYLDWVSVTKTNIESTYYIRSAATGNISALISYNAIGSNYVNGGVANIDDSLDVRYLAPMQAFWVRVGSAASTGSLGMNTGMLSHQTNNPGLKNSTVFPTLARVNLVDGPRFDQMLVFMNQDMINGVDAYDSEKMFVSGNPQIYTMAAGKKLVMNGLNSNKKKISVPVYLELPESKVYNLQLADYNLEDGLILLEDKQEGTIQDFTIHDTYAFYANSGVLQNRFVLHFYMPDATITAQGPSNNWVAEEGSYTEGGNILISSDAKGKVQISLDQPESEKVEGTVQATDANGRVVYAGALEGLTTEFQLNVPSGIYYLTVQTGNMIENKKVFIQD